MGRLRRFTVTPERYRLVADVALALLTLIVVAGAGVRLTGSGLGCPDWPSCHGRVIPPLDTHTWIEYSNRLFNSAVGIACIAAAVLAFRRRPYRRDLVGPALVMGLGVIAQGVLGGLVVVFGLTWSLVASHYLVSMVLLIAAALLAWRVRHEPAGARPASTDRPLTLATRGLAVYGAVVIVLGTLATAAGPHAGSAGTGEVVHRLDAWGAGTLKSLIHLHGHLAAVMGGLAVALWFVARRRGAHAAYVRALAAVCVLMALQGAVGLYQYHHALPAEVVWVHASLAAGLWLALLWSVLAAGRLEDARAREPASSRTASSPS